MKNLKEIEQLRKEFHFTLSKVTHEIRNPVALIHSQLQLLSEKHPELNHCDIWNDIEDNMEYLILLLNELSGYNNAETLHKETIELSEFFNALIASIEPTLRYLNITFEASVAPNLPMANIDPTKLRQALINLFRNAQEACDPYNKIHFIAEYKHPFLSIQIHDNGCGIPPEHLETLFEPFITYKKEGTGLGLAITKQIIEAHAGTVHVSSSPEAGTSFEILLPV